MIGGNFITAGQILGLDFIKKKNSAPIYLYEFDYEATFGFVKHLFGISGGVAHSDDVGYLFYAGAFKNLPEPGSSAEKMTRIMTKLWTNFAKDGNPTSKLDDDITVNWEPIGDVNNYLRIDTELKMEKNLLPERMEYWKKKSATLSETKHNIIMITVPTTTYKVN